MRKLPRAVFDFVDGGAANERTLRANADAFKHWCILPRLSVDTTGRSPAVTLLGEPSAMPVIIAPTGLAGLIRPQGDIILAKAAAAAGVPFCLSTMSVASLEDVTSAVPEGNNWFQLYPLRDAGLQDEFLDRAKTAGYRTLCISVDQPTHGRRLRDNRNNFTVPLRLTLRSFLDFATHPRWSLTALANPVRFGNFPQTSGDIGSAAQYVNSLFDSCSTWEKLERIRERWQGKLVIKGILVKEDADLACRIGADAIVISNHGGRQLDDVPPAAFTLPSVVDTVGGRAEVIIDGGVRTGNDLIKASALGARACMLGRPGLFGLAAAGAEGARRMLAILEDELNNAMTLMGTRTLGELTAGSLTQAGRPVKS